MDKIERLRAKAEIFLKQGTQAFITDKTKTFYWCNILYFDEYNLTVSNFAGKRKGEVNTIYFIDIDRFEEYEEKLNFNVFKGVYK